MRETPSTWLPFRFSLPYASIQSNFGHTLDAEDPVGTVLLGDANGDGVVSAGDYASIQANFGNVYVLPVLVII